MIRPAAVPSGSVPTVRSALWTLLVALATVAGAAIASFAVDRVGIGPPLVVPLAAALVVAGLFWARRLEGLLAFGLFSLLADTLEHWIAFDVLLFDELGLLLLVGVAVATRRLQLDRLRPGWLEASLLVLIGAGVASSLVQGVPLTTWLAGLFLLVKGVASFFLVSLLRLTAADVERVGLAMLVVAGSIGLLGLVEWLDPAAFQSALGLPLYEQVRGDVPIVKAIFLHPAQYGWLTAFGSLLCCARFITHRSWWTVPLALGLALGTFLSGRRTPLLGIAAAVGAGLAWWSLRLGVRRSLLRVWLPAAGIALVGVIVAAPAIQRLAAVTATEYGPSLELAGEVFAEEPRADVLAPVHPRIALYAGSLAIARDEFPLGGGIGRFGSHLSREDYSPLYARYGLTRVALLGPDDPQAATDAFWPMVLGETGAIGLVAALAFFGGMAVVLWRAASAATLPALRTILLAAVFVVIEGLVRSATSSVYVAPPIAYFVLGTAGAALAATATTAEAARETF